jgi:hypothetical protein
MTIDELLDTLLAIEGVEERKSRFSDNPALFVRDREKPTSSRTVSLTSA